MARSHLETEVKLRLEGAAAAKRKLLRIGYLVQTRRTLERNTIFDTADQGLRGKSSLLRLRLAGPRRILTFKGPPREGRYKSREEIELELADAAALVEILAGLGYRPVFRYEKYRTVYQRIGRPGLAMLDETPIGNFLELEGSPRSIDRMAGELGYSGADYILDSYGKLYLDHCARAGVRPRDMIFQRS